MTVVLLVNYRLQIMATTLMIIYIILCARRPDDHHLFTGMAVIFSRLSYLCVKLYFEVFSLLEDIILDIW